MTAEYPPPPPTGPVPPGPPPSGAVPPGPPPSGAVPPGWVNPAPVVVPEAFGLALLGATGVALLGVVGWVVLAESWQVRSALVAFAVAVGTAAVFRRFAPRHPMAPTAVVGLTIASAVIGLLASQYALLAQALHVGYFTAVKDVPLSRVPRLISIGTDPLTWIIVALSGYSGYRASMRLRVHQQQISRPGYGVPTTPDPALRHAAFGDLRAANEAAKSSREDDPRG